MSDTRKCYTCQEEKPLEDFPLSGSANVGGGHTYQCKSCKAADRRETQAAKTPEERNADMAAYRAGIRKATCAVCGAPEPADLCEGCRTAIRALGGTSDALKRAAKLVKYLGEV